MVTFWDLLFNIVRTQPEEGHLFSAFKDVAGNIKRGNIMFKNNWTIINTHRTLILYLVPKSLKTPEETEVFDNIFGKMLWFNIIHTILGGM